MSIEKPSGDRWAEWKKLFFSDIPAGIRAGGALVKVLVAIGAGILFLRLSLWPVIQYTMALAADLQSLDWPRAAVLVSLVVGFVAVFVGISVCVYRYLDTR